MTQKYYTCLFFLGRGSLFKTKAAGCATKKAVTTIPSIIHEELAAQQDDSGITEPRRTTMSFHATTPSTCHWIRLASPAAEMKDEGSRAGPSTAVTVAVALITMIVLAVIIALTFWLLRLRRRSRAATEIKGHDSPVMLPESPTPLVSLTGSHSSPDKLSRISPPRLQERRLLPQKTRWSSYRDSGRHQPSKHCEASPRSSAAGPATGPAPLSDKTAAASTRGEEQPSPSARPDTPPVTVHRTQVAAPNAMVSNNVSDPIVSTTSMPSGASAAASSRPSGATPAPLPRTPRQPYRPFPVAGLNCPGPPPNRVLPPTPRDVQRNAPAAPARQKGEAAPMRHQAAPVAASPPAADWSREPACG